MVHFISLGNSRQSMYLRAIGSSLEISPFTRPNTILLHADANNLTEPGQRVCAALLRSHVSSIRDNAYSRAAGPPKTPAGQARHRAGLPRQGVPGRCRARRLAARAFNGASCHNHRLVDSRDISAVNFRIGTKKDGGPRTGRNDVVCAKRGLPNQQSRLCDCRNAWPGDC